MEHPVIFTNMPAPPHTPPLLAPGEFRVSLQQLREERAWDQGPGGSYDVAATVATLPPPWSKPSAVITFWDNEGKTSPCNTAPLACPKILVVGDTHHGASPLSRAIALALQEPWDLIVLPYNKHHAHWFDESGIGHGRTHFIPCFGLTPTRLEVPPQRTLKVVCCGQIGPLHVYRRRILLALHQRGIPISLATGTREECARLYNASIVSLNISLNGDFNLRNFEIAAAGGFCLGDPTGVDPAERPGAVFRDVDDAVRIIRHLLDHPEESLATARRDQQAYWNAHTPQKKVDVLQRALAAPKGPRFAPSATFYNRLALYEHMQELTRRGMVWSNDLRDLLRWSPDAHPGPNEVTETLPRAPAGGAGA